jgi:hypothetical protein
MQKTLQIIDLIVLKILGYLLVFFGAGMLYYLGVQVWELYFSPELAMKLAVFLNGAPPEVKIPDEILKIIAWLLIMLLFMLIGRIAILSIDSGHKLITKHSDRND